MIVFFKYALAVPGEEAAAIAVIAAVNMILEDDADDEAEDEEVLQLLAAVERDRRAVPKTQNYFEEIIPRFSSSGTKV